MENIKNKRGALRFVTINFIIYVRYDDIGTRTDEAIGLTVDLSGNGLSLEVSHPCEVGEKIELIIGIRDEVIRTAALVKYLLKLPGDKWRIGVEFLHFNKKAQKLIDSILGMKTMKKNIPSHVFMEQSY